jgi:nucleotide-binding universal stress UspA family protein
MTTASTFAEPDAARRVVVGVSGSKASLAALATAAQEAKLRDAVLHVISVAEPPPPRAPYAPPHDEAADKVGDDLVGGSAASISPGVPVTYQRLNGPAPRMLQQAAHGAELLVLGRTNYGDVLGRTNRADLIGPTARACVAHASCPVLLVGPMPDE